MNNLVRNIILAVIVIVAALVVWLIVLPMMQDDTQSTSKTVVHGHKDQSAVTTPTTKKAEEKKKEPTVKEPKQKTNAAADGLSRFYANLHGDANGDGPVIKNNIVYLPDPKGDLEELLKTRAMNKESLRPSWTGKTTTHPFRKGEFLFKKLDEYSKQSGVDVISWLNRDFVVKDTFRINEDIITTAYQISRALGGNFENGLYAYFCYKQSAIVFVERNISYLKNECLILPRG